MDKVYVCVGSTGEYSDHREWYVKAFTDEEKCKKFVSDVTAEYGKLYPKGGSSYYEYSYKNRPTNPLDPDMSVDYTGTNYYMITVPFEA